MYKLIDRVAVEAKYGNVLVFNNVDKNNEEYFEFDEFNRMNYEHYYRVSGPAN